MRIKDVASLGAGSVCVITGSLLFTMYIILIAQCLWYVLKPINGPGSRNNIRLN